MKIDLTKFQGSLPYSSEMYGIYQPLLGWKSARVAARVDAGIFEAAKRYLADMLPQFTPHFDFDGVDDPQFTIQPARPETRGAVPAIPIDGLLGRRIATLVQESGDIADPTAWEKYTRPDALEQALNDIAADLRAEFQSIREGSGIDATRSEAILKTLLRRESLAAGVLAYMNSVNEPSDLARWLNLGPMKTGMPQAGRLLNQIDAAKSDLARAVVSPIGLVHLFRQYFFEFDSFLGPSVQHLWLSPGGTVELVEVSTRKTVIERATEQMLETTQKSETSETTEDELSAAVKSENSSNTKLGVSATATAGFKAAVWSGSATATGSFNIEQNQKEARETTHTSKRQQTEKLSSEIRSSFKSTFRTVTEATDVTSRRYVLQNDTKALLNYELRRKMRQVGVQVQDYGTQLCWQSFVDEPGDDLGVSLLVHIAQPPDLQNLREPERPPQPDPLVAAPSMTVNFSWPDGDKTNHRGFLSRGAPIKIVPPKPGYIYAGAQMTRVSGPDFAWAARPATPQDTQIDLNSWTPVTIGPPDIETIATPDGNGEPSIKTLWVGFQTADGGYLQSDSWEATLQVTLLFRPSQSLLKGIEDAYTASVSTYTEERNYAFQQALFSEARDRVKAASNVRSRNFDELREEERIVVYRCLIRQLLKVAGIGDQTPQVRHVFSELVESMFDVDELLYFVAPEWWMPRFPVSPSATAPSSPQNLGLGGTDQATFYKSEVVTWGGAETNRPDNYYVTEDSTPAKLGSSLGWVLQLDGDNLRNAFLNAPWVKAVIPIRAGRELRALEWLSSPDIEGSDGLGSMYEAKDEAERETMIKGLKAHIWQDAATAARYAALSPADLTILDAIRYLVVRIAAQHQVGSTVDPAMGCLPADRVFEHGFDPLLGGFRADPKDSVGNAFTVFDQWVEILPTDQIVPVEVAYDPRTGMQI